MTFDTDSGLRVPAADQDLDRRVRRLRELGLTDTPDAEFDAFAADLARAADVPYAMVNLITDHQYFAGLHSPAGSLEHPEVGRTMARDHGYCPDVLDRRVPLVLPDVYAAPHLASNPVVDRIGIRTYAGAPLIDEPTGTVLGTVCFVGTEPRLLQAGQHALELIKERRDALMNLIYQRIDHTTR
ncbi:GAF domain-containing protein [Streptomyces meridianus]|uniref:GAF domain-containing protein n=1 Tax=Streptomyces meridianus TaxID=2938945 RepID=A0ABT0X1C2_9ACTN|nr:GAF domain-containing protein [Streptomyces meridianus]MCM2576352.1 GAF domain-containing protein [Streptomyces meridianus]